MTAYAGLTWDHDRGRLPLEAASRLLEKEGNIRIAWNSQPLEGFESAPIERLLRQHDIVVLDHPHLGDAIEAQMLTPIDEIFDAASMRALEHQFVGPSLASYQVEGRTWALPLDAATQVASRRPDLCVDPVPTWTDVIELAKGQSVALSLAGPHALLTLISAYRGLEGSVDFTRGQFIREPEKAAEVLRMLQKIYDLRKADYAGLNPIQMLERMSRDGSVAYVPLVYGYVNYSVAPPKHAVVFDNVPLFNGHTVHGSTIGGTGLGVSRRAHITDALVEHLKWLISADVQSRFIPQHKGQPAVVSAWEDGEVNDTSLGFYRNTLQTMQHSWVRPRFPGYTKFQSQGSEIVRRAITSVENPHVTINELGRLGNCYAAAMSVKYV